MLRSVILRIRFALQYRTLKPAVVLPRASKSDPEQILICHHGALTQMDRRCPHQGAPLETGYFKRDVLICPWHGCRFPLKK